MADGGNKSRKELLRERDLLGLALAESERVISGILASVPAGVVHVTADFAIKTANAEATRILGLSYDDLTQRYVADFEPETIREDGSPCPPSDYPVVRAITTGEQQPRQTIGVRRPDGGISWCIFAAVPVVDDGGKTTGAVVTITDITDRKRAEEERADLLSRLGEAERLEALGRLAGGVAHDFNNLLTVILGSLDLHARKMIGPSSIELQAIGEASGQAAKLTRQLLAFGRRQPLAPSVFRLEEMATELRAVLEQLLGEQVRLRVRHQGTPRPVFVDRTAMERVLVNLAANARDALPDGGRVAIDVRDVVVTADEPGQVPPGSYVELCVADSGEGVSDELRNHIFEPFFTTKDGKGTGLGLATVHGMVTQSGGQVSVGSSELGGALFRILLPAFDGEGPASADDETRLSGRGQGRCVLLVEDDSGVRRVASAVLADYGFEVRAMGSAAEAMQLRADDLADVALLLTDVVMPDHHGPEVAQALRAQRPDLPVLYISGHVPEKLGAIPEEADFLAKPFSPMDLIRRVRAAIDRAKDS